MNLNEYENQDDNWPDSYNDQYIDETTAIKVKNVSNKKSRKKRIILDNNKIINLSSLDIFYIIVILIIIFTCIILFISTLKAEIYSDSQDNINNNIDLIKDEGNNANINSKEEENGINALNETISKFEFNSTNKLKIAFVYSSLYANGIARFISVTANNFIKTGKYEIYVVTEYKSSSDYYLESGIQRIIAKNRTLVKNATKDLGIDFFILQNVMGKGIVDFYKKFCKKVIGMFHGLYMSAMFHGSVGPYKGWNSFDFFDAYVFIGYDDYFFYKKLGFKNEIFIPNLYTFDPDKIQSSNLTGHNIVMLGRAADSVKGYIYAVKTMPFIVKEVPDAKLIILSSNTNINFLKDTAKNLSVYDNIIFNKYTANISEVFWNSSVLMYTSLSEAFPLAIVEAKAHGLPVAAFDVAYSPPYQVGVIGVDMLDCEALANETIKLLKDYDYRKKMGQESKLSLNQFKNEETIKLWERLFIALMEGPVSYRKLQKEIEDKYYDEDKARERMEKRYRDLVRYNKNFTCHSIINFTDINFVKNVKLCPLNSTNTTTT